MTSLIIGESAKNSIPAQSPKTVKYKTIDDTTLRLHVFAPSKTISGTRTSAIVFFFGGAWTTGTPEQFYPQCRYFASLGSVAISAEYRIKSKYDISISDCIKDAKSAIRWVRANADKLNVAPDKIIAAGGSAGGHLAACTAVIDGYEEENEDLSISSKPNAVVLFNPALGTTEDGYGSKRLTDRIRDISPMHHVKKGIPPFIIFHGIKDKTVPIQTIESFCKLMEDAGNNCKLVPFEGMGHGFFNYGEHDNKPFEETLRAADEFLTQLGFLAPKPSKDMGGIGLEPTTPTMSR